MHPAAPLKEGAILSFSILQNTTTYQIRIAHCPKGLWVCIQQLASQWKATISQQQISQTISKASGGKIQLNYKQFTEALLLGLKKQPGKWSIGIMTPTQLEILRGVTSSKKSQNTKIYLILSDTENRIHFPFTLLLTNMMDKEKLKQAIVKMKSQLQQLRYNNDKSHTSFSILSETAIAGQSLRIENEQLKKKIKMYEDSLTQKRGAVEIDMILKQKNNLQLQAETKKRQQNRQIAKYKAKHQLLEKEVNEVRHEVDFITRQLTLLQDSVSNPAKLKNHAMRVLKNYELELRTSKKIIMKQTKQMDNIKRNINNAKNTQKRILAKIKQIQTQIEQAKKKANIKEISNRLHSPGNSKQGSSAANSSQKAPSLNSDGNRSNPANRVVANRNQNLVRQNLLKRVSDQSASKQKNNLLKTTPIIGTPTTSMKKVNQYKPPVRPVVSSHVTSNSPVRKEPLKNNFTYTRPRNTSVKTQQRSAHSNSTEKKKQFTAADKEKQKIAMQRLTGGIKKKQNPPSSKGITSNKNIGKAPVGNQRGSSLNRPTFGSAKKIDSSKQILNKMKEVKAQYNNRSTQNNVKNNVVVNKVNQLADSIHNK